MLRKIIILLIPIFIIGCKPVNASEVPTQVISSPTASTFIAKSTPTDFPTLTPSPFPSSSPAPTVEPPTISISPDKKWKILGVTEWEAKVIVSQDGKVRWNLENPLEKYGWYEWSYILYRWSTQTDIAYLTIHPTIDGFVPFYQGSGLYRFNLSDGTMMEILPGQQPNVSNFSLSPDENLIAYESHSDDLLSLKIKHIETGSEKQIPLNGYDSAGHILWSPDQDSIVFSVSTGDDWTNWHISLVSVNLKNLSSTIIYDNEKQALRPREWLNQNEILVSSGENFYILDIKTKKLKDFVQPTPTP